MIQKTLTSFFAAPQPSAAKTEEAVKKEEESDVNVPSSPSRQALPAKIEKEKEEEDEEEAERPEVKTETVQDDDAGVGKENEVVPKAGGACDYEKIREERMQRNRDMLRKLQVDQVLKEVSAKPKGKVLQGPGKERRRKRKKTTTSTQPVRRSTRRSTRSSARLDPLTKKQKDTATEVQTFEIEEKFEEPSLVFAPSAVADYDTNSLQCLGLTTRDSKEVWRSYHFQKLPATHTEASFLRRIYTSDFSNGCLVIAGEKGFASVYGLDNNSEAESTSGATTLENIKLNCLLDAKLHRSWISNTQFLSSPANGGKRLLLSSANDGSLSLWDINNAAWSKSMNSYVPQEVASVRFHAQGIFSMHESEGSIIAGSKDRSISVSCCRESCISQVVAWEDAHAGVVKSVRFADPQFSTHVFASAGNDRRINLWDLRQQKMIGSISGDAHASAINALEWSGHLLMSTSFDPSIRLDDLRLFRSCTVSGSIPLSVINTPKLLLEGHLVPNSKPRGINHPIFIDNGRRVVSGGEKTNLLSVFDATESGQGAPLSRGTIDFNPSSLHYIDEGELQLLVAAGEGQLCLFRPVES